MHTLRPSFFKISAIQSGQGKLRFNHGGSALACGRSSAAHSPTNSTASWHRLHTQSWAGKKRQLGRTQTRRSRYAISASQLWIESGAACWDQNPLPRPSMPMHIPAWLHGETGSSTEPSEERRVAANVRPLCSRIRHADRYGFERPLWLPPKADVVGQALRQLKPWSALTRQS